MTAECLIAFLGLSVLLIQNFHHMEPLKHEPAPSRLAASLSAFDLTELITNTSGYDFDEFSYSTHLIESLACDLWFAKLLTYCFS